MIAAAVATRSCARMRAVRGVKVGSRRIVHGQWDRSCSGAFSIAAFAARRYSETASMLLFTSPRRGEVDNSRACERIVG
jgi:hypothetical protein